MAKHMHPRNVRASDSIDVQALKHDDFKVRRGFPTVREMAKLCLSAVLIVFGVVILVRNDTLVGALVCTLVGGLMLYLGRSIEKQQKVINATEFMNALFSSALSKDYQFCLIAREDGGMIYFDRGFQKAFPEFMLGDRRDLAGLCNHYQVDANVAERLGSIISSGKQGELQLAIPARADSPSQTFSVTCEPIARPKGYVLVRGK